MIKQNNKIEILTFFNHHHQILYDLFFKPTFEIFLSENFILSSKYAENIKSENIQEYGFEKRIWQKIIFDRFNLIIDHIQANKDPNTISIFSDVDVIFFGNFIDDLKPFIANKKLHIVYMCEFPYSAKHDINGGFFAFRHSDQAIQHFQNITQIMLSNNAKNDQPIIQDYIRHAQPEYIDILSSENFGANNCHISINRNLIDQGKLKVFHATSTYSIYEKILVLNNIVSSIKDSILIYKNFRKNLTVQ